MSISRVGFVAKPSRDHREFKEWEVADVLVLVPADTRDDALARAREVLTRERWQPLSVTLCDRLIEERVREQGGEFLECYERAVAKGSALRAFPRNFAAGKSGIPAIRPPRVTEEFMDIVVADVGGTRLPTDDKNQMADYRIDDWLFELKDLQQEGLRDESRQSKLAELFTPYRDGYGPIQINPDLLTESERERYYDIISSPLKKVRDAGRQIRSTKEVLGEPSLKGGIMYLNTGFASFPHDRFGPLVEEHIRRHTSQIEGVFAVSTYIETNGFDSWIYFQTHLSRPEHKVLLRLREAFGKRFEERMTQLVTGMLPVGAPLSEPPTPVAFQVGGLDFAWLPPAVPQPFQPPEGE